MCRAAEQTPGESGAGRLSPVWSSDLAQWGQARKHPGSEVAGAGSPCAERCVLLGPKRSSRKATAWSCTLFTCLGQGQPLRPHLPLKNERRSRQRSSSSARKRRAEVPPARQSERCRPERSRRGDAVTAALGALHRPELMPAAPGNSSLLFFCKIWHTVQYRFTRRAVLCQYMKI